MAFLPSLRRVVASVAKDAPLTDVATMDQIVSQFIAQPRFETVLLASFGVLGLALAMVGIYGVISYRVTQRTREIGVRVALGAQRGNILGLVLREALVLAVAGVFLGLAGSFALTRFLRSLLFAIKPADPVTFAAVAVLLLLVALFASYLPARRAMRVDPLAAIRCE
jgi:ABC-type antimicrobial peptide transport system permease subunit